MRVIPVPVVLYLAALNKVVSSLRSYLVYNITHTLIVVNTEIQPQSESNGS